MSYGMTLADGSSWEINSENAAPSYPSGFSFRDILGGIKDVTNFAVETQQQFSAIQSAAAESSFDRFMQSLSMDTARTVAKTQAMTAEAQAKAELAKAQGAAAPGAIVVSQSIDTLQRLAAIAGIIGVVYMIAKGTK